MKLLDIYHCLHRYYGPQHWWPAEGPFEVIVGAILTQSTAWTNVEKGIYNLKHASALSPQILRELEPPSIAQLIHPCGYYNVKAVKLKAFASWFGQHFSDNLEQMSQIDWRDLRTDLLQVFGIGEETADSILLYACRKPVFVIDAYTRRIIDRLGLKPQSEKYGDYQRLFMAHLPSEVPMYNEYHALLVALGKNICRKTITLCHACCLREICQVKVKVSFKEKYVK